MTPPPWSPNPSPYFLGLLLLPPQPLEKLDWLRLSAKPYWEEVTMKPRKRGVKDTEEERAHVPKRRSWGGLQCWAGAADNPPQMCRVCDLTGE